jgi:hypothetical protein
LSSLAFAGAFCRPSPFVKSGFRFSLIQRCSSSTPCVVTLFVNAPNTVALSSYLLRGLIIFSVLFRASPSFHTGATITILTTRQLCFSSRLENTSLVKKLLLHSLVFVYWPGISSPRVLVSRRPPHYLSFFTIVNSTLWFKYCPQQTAHGLVPLFSNPACDTIYASEV